MRFFFGLIILTGLFSCQTSEEIKYEQYLIKGEELYVQNCANCHGKKGEGLQSLYPPLIKANFLKDRSALICIIKNGRSTPLEVNGKLYTQPMPKVPNLYALDIATISTYVLHNFGGVDSLVDANEVDGVACK
ncbi:MAG: c-type cytochrome [Leadbetterella sp.]